MRNLLTVVAFGAGIFLAPSAAYGLLASSGGSLTFKGLSLSPAIEQLDLQPGQVNNSYQIRIDNNLNTDMTVSVNSLDFKSLNDSGGLFFIGTGINNSKDKYGLTNWISLPRTPMSLKPHGGQFVTVTIDNRSDLSPGGHYAAILFHVNSQSTGGVNRVNLNQVASSLLFVRKIGGEKYSLSLSKVQLKRSIFSWPGSADLFFSNTGNVQTAPYGTVVLGKSSTVINPGSNLVLPESSRVFITPLSASKPGLLPKTYDLKINYRPDGLKQFSSYEVHFWYINPLELVLTAVILVLALKQPRHLRSLAVKSKDSARKFRKITRQ
jgi:hypothetical protein